MFLGAGAARACGLPDIAELRDKVLTALDADQKKVFESQLSGRGLEQALSRLRKISALLDGSDGTVDGLTGKKAAELDRAVCRVIVSSLDLKQASIDPMLNLAAWATRANYLLPVELFTVNYDLLLETALEALGVMYFDGFAGTLRARFRTDIVEADSTGADGLPAFIARLWKLHGSVNWAWEDTHVVRLGAPVTGEQPAAIYPSDAKYDESRRVPFVVLQDRFRRAMEHPETLMIVSGYSFGDQHLNEMIFGAAQRRPRSEFAVFCHGEIPDVLAKKATSTPNLQALAASEAIISGVRAEWKPPTDVPEDLWVDETFGLRDFTNLAAFLARSSPPQAELQARLAELLSVAVEQSDA